MSKKTWDMDMAASRMRMRRWEKGKRDTAVAVLQGRHASMRACGELVHCARAIRGFGDAADVMGGRSLLVLSRHVPAGGIWASASVVPWIGRTAVHCGLYQISAPTCACHVQTAPQIVG